MKKFYSLVLIIFIIGVALRLYKIDGPVADWHSWRQSDTASVARNYVKHGVDLLRPRFDDLSNIPSGKDNPQGYRMVEFPLYQAFGTYIFRLMGEKLSIEIVLRLITALTSSATAVLLILITTRFSNIIVGLLVGIFYAILPYNIYYGRAILPDPFMVFWAVLSVYLAIVANEKKGFWLWLIWGLSAFCAAIALLVKPVGIFLLFPIPFVIWKHHQHTRAFAIQAVSFALISLLPVWAWRQWILNFPEGIPVYKWLFNEGNIRFKGAWFYWLFAERISKLITGYWGVCILVLGVILPPKKEEAQVFRLWLLGALLYMIIIARGNVQHDYYQILILPILCVYLGKGLYYLLTSIPGSRIAKYTVSMAIVGFMLAFSWYTVRTYYWINRMEIVEVGSAANELLPPEAKVIAPYNGDTTFLYQIRRSGWPLGFDIEHKISLGATHYVTLSPTDADGETKDLVERYTVMVRNDQYAIIDLTKPKMPTSGQ